ncbi:MAG: BrnT family toxin [Castellaniella sp.]|uniref:BrnT family toxin n=1 Tax=Castellaniella sp. TaxID=1955812 RepID=UPI003C73AFFE
MDDVHWDEAKRSSNLDKHGLDFKDAGLVLNSPYRLDADQTRHGEQRTQSFAYVFDVLAVLTVVHHNRNGRSRIISFRSASLAERRIYYAWLENHFNVVG